MTVATHDRRYTLDYPELGTDPVPVEPYISEEYFKLEQEKVFKRTWLNVGRVEEIPNAGDYFVRELPVCKTSILVTRGKDGVIRGFHNVCQHRGTKLVWNESGCCQAFACKYHGWSYAPDGRLIGVPEEDMFFDFDKRKIRLAPVATDVWEGFIFINLDPNPEESLQAYLGELVGLLHGFPFSDLPVCYSYKADLKCNWKIIVDSQQEGYHAKMLHRRSLPGFLTNKENPSSHVIHMKLYKRHRVISYYGNRTRKPSPAEALAYQFGTSVAKFVQEFSGEKMPKGLNPTRDPHWAFDEYVIFPNFHLLLFFGMYITHHVWPVAVDRAIWEARAYLPRAENAAEMFSREYSKCLLRDAWLEDGSTLEASQVGLESGAITHFILQDQELMIRHFQKVLRDYIGV
ncbi:MAG: aromatic ring-hydroxylating dioxygenase subunit alpha [Acidobacteria bacterium]|nr:aromatic ring-hydroxylating dioxygenase subunit alpha [Acidobacteriota bacterium]